VSAPVVDGVDDPPVAPDEASPLPPADRPARPRRRRRLVRSLVAVIAVVLVAVAVWLVGWSPVLAVRDVRVVGVDDPAAVQAVLDAASIPTGVPLVRIDTNAPQAAVGELPWVASVDVRRGWPSEVVVAVEVRTPVAVVAGTSDVVDASGVSFTALDQAVAGLPTVRATGDGLATAAAVLAALPPDLADRVVSATASSRDDVALTLRSGSLVRWGSDEQMQEKAQALRALLTRKRAMYDVSAPSLVTTFRP
jgi:cell division protein FtsQ